MNAAATLEPFLSTPSLAELGPGSRAGTTPLSPLNGQLDEMLGRAALAGDRASLVRAAILLWHDHLDDSHVIAQDIETRDGSYVHAIMHRREPDYGNAKYWFHRVGQHPCFDKLSARVATLLKADGSNSVLGQFLPNGQWDAFAFVDACEAVANRPLDDGQELLLREIQRIEFEVLLDHLCRPPTG